MTWTLAQGRTLGVSRTLALAGLLVLAARSPARAQAGLSGGSGYFNAPTSEVFADAAGELGYNYVPRQWAYDHRGQYRNDIYFATIGFLPRLEVTLRLTSLPGNIIFQDVDPASRLTDVDRMIAGKVQVLPTSGPWPSVTLGMDDPFGTRRFHATYLVLGRRFRVAGVNLRADAGYAPLLLHHVGRPTLHGAFAGVEVRLMGRLGLVGEYDTEKFNLGLKIKAPLGLTGRVVWLNAQQISGGIGLGFHL